jgi:hypothetical protein
MDESKCSLGRPSVSQIGHHALLQILDLRVQLRQRRESDLTDQP